MRCVLVVPCYNEARRLPAADFRAFQLRDHDLHLLFVNDGSTDDTSAVLAGLAAEDPEHRSYLDLPRNAGKAEAVRQGVLRAVSDPADAVGFWDADLATPLSELDGFCDVLTTRPEVDVVIGSRVRMLGRSIERRSYRHAYGRVFATAVSSLLSLPVYDSQCGAKLFRVNDDLGAVFAEPFVSRWVFDVEILARYVGRWEARGLDSEARMVEVPLLTWKHVGGSKIGAADAAVAGVDLLRIAARYRDALALRRRRR